MAAKKRKPKPSFTDAEELMFLRELRDACSSMFAEGAAQDGEHFHFDWKRTDVMRKALVLAEIMHIARKAEELL